MGWIFFDVKIIIKILYNNAPNKKTVAHMGHIIIDATVLIIIFIAH